MPRSDRNEGPNLPPGAPHLPATSASAAVSEQAPPPAPPAAPAGTKSLAEELGLDDAATFAPVEPRFAWRCGVLPDCPLEVVHVGGVAFPRYTERVSGGGPETMRSAQAGGIAYLTEAHRQKVIAAIKVRFVRRRGARAEVILVGAPTIAPAKREQGDEPLAKFVYMTREPSLDPGPQAADALPPSLAEVAAAGR
jgi:hypothetical protein